MASVFKLGRDKKKRGAVWYFEYVDHDGKRRMKKGFTEKSLTEQLATKLETEARLRRSGFIDGEQADLKQGKQTSVEPYLNEFERCLSNRKNTPKHVTLTMGRTRRIIQGTGIQTLGEITLDAVESYLVELREEEDLGHRTYNHYVQAIESFCNWLVQKRRLLRNPLLGITRLNNDTDVRHARRALTPEEFGKLVQSARDSNQSIQCYTGEQRARLYILSYMTGLRRGELASLTPQSFELDGSPPTVTIKATISKHRKKDTLPLHADLVEMLRHWMSGLGPTDYLFPSLARRRTWLMVKKDLERVGIPYENEEGIADFHAAGRHTHITELLRNGASLPEAQQLARHTDVSMTMKYTHIGIEDQARALASLPAPCQDIVRKSADFGCPEKSAGDIDGRRDGPDPSGVSHSPESSYDTKKQKEASDDSDAPKWRRRDLNPRE